MGKVKLKNGIGGRVFDTKIWDKVKNKYKSHAGGVSESEIITWAETISKKEVSNVDEAIKILRNKEVIKIGALDGGKKVNVIEVDEWSDKRISDYEKEFGHPHYGLGGVLLGSAIGGYAGYKIGRARPQKSGFDTEKKIASKLKKGASKVKQDLKEGAEKRKKKKLATSMAKGGSGGKMKQGYNDRMDESLGMRHKGSHSQSKKDRRDESKGMEKSMGRRAYASVGTMDKMARGGEIKKGDKYVDDLGVEYIIEIVTSKNVIATIDGNKVEFDTESVKDDIANGNWKSTYAEGGRMMQKGEVVEIFINDYPYYIRKGGDTTHFFMGNNARFVGSQYATAHHIGQHKGTELYEDLRKWLKGGSNGEIYGKRYSDNSGYYAEGGTLDDGSSSGVWFTYATGGEIEANESNVEVDVDEQDIYVTSKSKEKLESINDEYFDGNGSIDYNGDLYTLMANNPDYDYAKGGSVGKANDGWGINLKWW